MECTQKPCPFCPELALRLYFLQFYHEMKQEGKKRAWKINCLPVVKQSSALNLNSLHQVWLTLVPKRLCAACFPATFCVSKIFFYFFYFTNSKILTLISLTQTCKNFLDTWEPRKSAVNVKQTEFYHNQLKLHRLGKQMPDIKQIYSRCYICLMSVRVNKTKTNDIDFSRAE